ncbi:MAG: molecular chaperone HtpG [Gammaproteobacteria bacterium]|nr:molecular chaperone HtpG [Gammaproteobacteria bacterium]
MTVETHRETLDFQTEAKQLLHLMIHSLYSNKEIFLRELLSNAADACDKLRFEALTDDALYEGRSDLNVRIDIDKEARTLTITDNGIGMNRQEVMDNIGTIAHSGTRQFLNSLSGDQAKDARLIGQFGVGFYSSFIVADKVTVETRRAGLGAEHGVRWESDGEGTYSLETIERADRGTRITLHLRKDEGEFLEDYRLRTVVRKYSDSIALPIVMKAEADRDEAEETEAKPDYETVNQASALWTRPKSEITDEEYGEFYKHVGHDFENPLTWVHTRTEGRQSYTSLLFIPQRAPFDLWDQQQRHGIKLYVRRVFIMEDAEQLMPRYLRFVRGVIDSDDLPLNVSREILQNNRQIDVMRAASVKKVLGLLDGMAKDDADKYQRFWKEFGRVLKEGIVEDYANKEALAKLLRFTSTASEGDAEDVSLADYVSRMKEGQDKIYYITADSLTAARNSPHLEVFKKKGIEVLLMHERVDDWMLTALDTFDDKPLRSVAKGDLELGNLEDEAEKEARKQAADELGDIVQRMKDVLGDQVKDVRVTDRLTDSPACLVVEEDEMALNLRRMLESAGQAVPHSEPILEVNPTHPLMANIRDEQDEDRFKDWVHILHDQALLSEGGQLKDPALFVKRLNGLLHRLAS